MSTKPITFSVAIGFFIFWLAVLLAGADFPPPIGFIWLIFLDIIAAGLVYLRIPTYIHWSANSKRGRFLRVLLDGFAASFTFALLTVLFSGDGDPSVPPPGFVEYLIWFTVLIIVGVMNATAVYGIVNLLNGRKTR